MVEADRGMESCNPGIERLARELDIERVPDLWRTHWHAFQEWRSDRPCGVEMGAIPPNAREVFALPSKCMGELESVCAEIRKRPALIELGLLWHFLLFHLPGGRALAEDVLSPPKGALGERAPLFRIAVLVSGTEHALDVFRAMGVSERIALDSLAQCGAQVRDYHAKYGVYGMRYLGWMRNYFQGKMFRLGRLVFNPNDYTWPFRVYQHRTSGELMTLCEAGKRYGTDGLADGTNSVTDPNAWESDLEVGADFARGNPVLPGALAAREPVTLSTSEWQPLITPGDHMVEVHIPGRTSGGKLLWEDCLASYAQAIEFFPRYYPQMKFTLFTCWSWLLDPSLPKILPPESNIVKFQSPFHLLPVVGSEGQCYDLAFGHGTLDITAVIPTTSLQRAIVDFVRAGNRMRSAAGFITMDEMRAICGH